MERYLLGLRMRAITLLNWCVSELKLNIFFSHSIFYSQRPFPNRNKAIWLPVIAHWKHMSWLAFLAAQIYQGLWSSAREVQGCGTDKSGFFMMALCCTSAWLDLSLHFRNILTVSSPEPTSVWKDSTQSAIGLGAILSRLLKWEFLSYKRSRVALLAHRGILGI